MTEKQSEITEALATKLEAGTLTVDELRRGIDALLPHADKMRQDILYLQSNNTSLQGEVIGMTMIEDGQLSEGPSDPKDWPYKTVLEAVSDGWRIISFPNMALLAVSESDPQGLGFEFILERFNNR